MQLQKDASTAQMNLYLIDRKASESFLLLHSLMIFSYNVFLFY